MTREGFPDYRDRTPWWGADLQTLRNNLRGPRIHGAGRAAPIERRKIPLSDDTGDSLVAALQHPAQGAADPTLPLVVLVHGLGGTEDSPYLLASAAHFLAAGFSVLRMNLRGAGPSRPHCRLQYHAGRSVDLRDALRALEPEFGDRGFALVGFSLGGNMLLKFTAEHAPELPVRGVVSISAPIDLSAASQRFLHPRNRIYHWWLLNGMKEEAFAAGPHISPEERRNVQAARSIWEFDERFVAPRNGYRGAEHYYAENNARRFLPEIRVPSLVIHAQNDPWIPADAYTTFPWDENPHLVPLLPPSGGHVGFHAIGSRTPWHDRCAEVFIRSLRSL